MIFYFSGTGNTRWAAELVAKATGERLVYIPDAMRAGRYEYTLMEGERLGFCFPTHGWQPPRLVREFVGELKLHSAATPQDGDDTTGAACHYCWALTTCGDNMGETMTIFNKELEAKGLRAQSMFAVVMPESNVCFPFLHLDTAEREQAKIARARERMEHVCRVIEARQQGVVELVKGAIPRTYSYVIGEYYNRHLIRDDKLWVDEVACVRCGRCQQLCPVDDISTTAQGDGTTDGQATPPRWLHNGRCTNCLACYHYCPQHAIHWGKMVRGQYHFRGER